MRALVVVATLAGTPAVAAERPQDDLEKQFQRSRVEVQSPKHRGAVMRAGRVFVIALAGVTAKPFRVAQANLKSPAFHAMDYARVDVVGDQIQIDEDVKPGERIATEGSFLLRAETARTRSNS